MSVEVREATPDDSLGVRRVLDAAMLDVRDDLDARIEAGDVLIVSREARHASENRATAAQESEDAAVLGALVLVHRNDGAGVDAVAVRRARRGQGLGTRLVRAAAERHARRPLVAEFDPAVRPFYESLGFEISPTEDDRLRGIFEAED